MRVSSGPTSLEPSPQPRQEVQGRENLFHSGRRNRHTQPGTGDVLTLLTMMARVPEGDTRRLCLTVIDAEWPPAVIASLSSQLSCQMIVSRLPDDERSAGGTGGVSARHGSPSRLRQRALRCVMAERCLSAPSRAPSSCPRRGNIASGATIGARDSIRRPFSGRMSVAFVVDSGTKRRRQLLPGHVTAVAAELARWRRRRRNKRAR